MFLFNIIAIILISTVIANEIENGQLRMILICPFSTTQLFFSKISYYFNNHVLVFNSILDFKYCCWLYLFFPRLIP
ncbi:ABC transporter permease [Peribacillus frigoritolerans]|nr:ABC transporter permease [Peribacillus frigoritolerans]